MNDVVPVLLPLDLCRRAEQRARALGVGVEVYLARLVERDVQAADEELRARVAEQLKSLGYMQ